jgi:hypothetical protein
MWVDAVAHGASMERRKAGAHGAQGCNGTTSEAPYAKKPKAVRQLISVRGINGSCSVWWKENRPDILIQAFPQR